MKDRFIEIYKSSIEREGADKLLEWLENSDFFIAPASTKYHGNYEGGLLEHSLNVYRNLNAVCFDKSQETIAICALLHDICKVNYYTTEMRNVKENGSWIQKPYYAINDTLPYGHGEKSVYIISSFMKLTREEAMAIRAHMGGFDSSVKAGDSFISQIFEKFPLALNLHIADMIATYFDDKKVE